MMPLGVGGNDDIMDGWMDGWTEDSDMLYIYISVCSRSRFRLASKWGRS